MSDTVTPISARDAFALLQARDDAVLFDIRDNAHFRQQHADGARHLSNDNLQQELDALDFEQPILVMCYHGISSLNAGHYLANLGFEQVFSIEGGFEGWQAAGLPVKTSTQSR
ncbi:thiosulfate sulfurtransferase GlpE [Pasteurellaceae bacterium HPA106]|uniref:thiosulfate sulfurtransferase GlpE n=1 Tax=Spirabiliibacterium pneumoniae TaxID=221400 RepID=UPI001AAC67BE|nr:thiosulfate sulfurtransferase GlpE [Spirabiliibacterium pneumoniae]MBE2896021.1 thiosulfate sulfurtransferase GlpE [Spirabiliibacterium pneumoniae]